MIAVILGMLFGGGLYLVGATQGKNIKGMLGLKNLVLMKIIIFGIGFESFLVSIVYFLGIFDVTHLCIKPLHLGVVLGGMIFVFGFVFPFFRKDKMSFQDWLCQTKIVYQPNPLKS